MTAPSMVCPECGEDVPFGRRTCEACGANVAGLASHAEAAESDAPANAAPELASERVGDEAPAERSGGMAADVAAATEQAAPVEWPQPAEPAAPVEWPRPTAPEPPLEPTPSGAEPFVPPVLREWNPGSSLPETGFATELAVAEREAGGLAGAWLPPAVATREASPEWPPQQRAADEPPLAPSAPPDIPAQAASATPPGAMPATLAAMLSRSPTGTPRWPGPEGEAVDAEAAARAAAAPAATTPPSRMPDLGRAMPAAAASPPESRPLEPGRAPLFADLPFDAPETLPGWLVVGGGALATVSFLLPWVAVIDSYFGAWGLGALSNLPAFLVVFGTTALAILPSRLADWLRHGILGLAVGSFILGITWNRIVGATGAQLGVILEATGALLLLIGGILAIVRDRPTPDGPAEHR